MSDPIKENENPRIQAHIPPDLEYVYRDISNVFVGIGDVVLEFGNMHRSMPGHATISNRIVLSVASAYQLQQSIAQALDQAQQEMQTQL